MWMKGGDRMRAWDGKFELVVGLCFLAVGIGGATVSVSLWGALLSLLIGFVLALPILNQFRCIVIDENGISDWRLLRGKRRILWSQVREIDVGGNPAKLSYRRECAEIYVAPRALTDAERVQIMNCRDAIGISYYYGGKRDDLLRAAVLQYYPGEVPPVMRTVVEETEIRPTYIVRREAAGGSFTEESGEILDPEQLFLETRGW